MEKSGIEELWTESGIYGSNITRKIINGTHYYRSRNTHELTFEAMSLKVYESFSVWFENQTDLDKQLIKNVKQKKQCLIKAFLGSEYDETAIRSAVAELLDVLEEVEAYLAKFVSEGSAHSDIFAYIGQNTLKWLRFFLSLYTQIEKLIGKCI